MATCTAAFDAYCARLRGTPAYEFLTVSDAASFRAGWDAAVLIERARWTDGAPDVVTVEGRDATYWWGECQRLLSQPSIRQDKE